MRFQSSSTKLKMRLKYYIYEALGRGNDVAARVVVKQVRKTGFLKPLLRSEHQVRALHWSTVSAHGHRESWVTGTLPPLAPDVSHCRQAELRTQCRAEEGEVGQHKEAGTDRSWLAAEAGPDGN